MDYTTKRAYVIMLMRALRTHTGVGHTDSIQHNIFDSEKLKFFVVILTGFLVTSGSFFPPFAMPYPQ